MLGDTLGPRLATTLYRLGNMGKSVEIYLKVITKKIYCKISIQNCHCIGILMLIIHDCNGEIFCCNGQNVPNLSVFL